MDNLENLLCNFKVVNGANLIIVLMICDNVARMILSLGIFFHINIYEIVTFIWSEILYNQLNPNLLPILTLYPSQYYLRHVCPPVRMGQLGCHWTDVHEI
jgi:hypothetical protein